MIFGIAEELLQLSMRYGPGTVPPGWEKWRSLVSESRVIWLHFSPAAFVLGLDEVLQSAGVSLYLDTLACLPVLQGRRVIGVEVENKGGRGLLSAQCVIDATGDADLAYRAGASCVVQDNWMSFWSHQILKEKLASALQSTDGDDLLKATYLHLGANDTGKGHPEGMPKFFGTSGEQVTQFVLKGRGLLREYYRQQSAERKNRFALTLPAMAQFRTTRRIEGLELMVDGQHNQHRPTSIGLTGDWRKSGPVWEIRMGR